MDYIISLPSLFSEKESKEKGNGERETKGKYLSYNVLKIHTSYFDDRCTDKQVYTYIYVCVGRFFARENKERKKKQQQQSPGRTMTNIYIFVYVRRIHTNFDVSIMDGRE